jgi:hypothetical protein
VVLRKQSDKESKPEQGCKERKKMKDCKRQKTAESAGGNRKEAAGKIR